MSRRFAGVGVGIAAARLREIAAGAPASDVELVDVDFAVTASELRHEQRVAKFEHAKRECVRGLIVAGVGLLLLGFLLFVTLAVLCLALHTVPFAAGLSRTVLYSELASDRVTEMWALLEPTGKAA